jgi:tetratricopeptide (TPR) repeat protein
MRRFNQSKFICVTMLCAALISSSGIALAQSDPGGLTTAEVQQSIALVRDSGASAEILSRALSIGQSLLRAGRFAEAVELFSVLAEKRPTDFAVVYGQALATFNVGRAAEAEPLARKAMEIATSARPSESEPQRAVQAADSLVLLAVIVSVRKDDQAALKFLQRAIQIAPRHFDAQLSMGRLLFGMGDDNGAIKFFRAANSLQPANSQAMFFLATALEHRGDMDGALSTYRRLIELRPDLYEGHLGLGALLLKQGEGNVDGGLRELTRALEINPNLYEARIAVGRTLIARGQPSEAITHLRRAAELAPGNPEPHYQLSVAYRRLGRDDAAAEEAAIVKRINESRRGK